MEDRIRNLERDIHEIRTNHLEHLATDVKELGGKVENMTLAVMENKVNLSWIKKGMWVVIIATVGSLVAAIMNGILK